MNVDHVRRTLRRARSTRTEEPETRERRIDVARRFLSRAPDAASRPAPPKRVA